MTSTGLQVASGSAGALGAALSRFLPDTLRNSGFLFVSGETAPGTTTFRLADLRAREGGIEILLPNEPGAHRARPEPASPTSRCSVPRAGCRRRWWRRIPRSSALVEPRGASAFRLIETLARRSG